LMMRFTWMHELYHGLNGHAGYVASLLGETALREMPDDADLALVDVEEADTAGLSYERIRHCLEFDADRTAYQAMTRLQMTGDEPFEVLAEKPLPLRLKLVTFAAIMMTFLFDQSAKRHASGVGTTHPAANLRLHNLVRTMASHLFDQSEQMQETLAQVLPELDRLQPRIPSLISSGALLRDLSSPEFQAELDRMEDDLARLRIALAPFAYRL